MARRWITLFNQNYYWFYNSDLIQHLITRLGAHILAHSYLHWKQGTFKWQRLSSPSRIFFAVCRVHKTGSIPPSRAAQCSTPQCVPSAMLAPGLQFLPLAPTPSWMQERETPCNRSFHPTAHPTSQPPTTPPPLPLNKPPASDDLANLHDSHVEEHRTQKREDKRREGGGAPPLFFHCLSVPFFSSPPPLVSLSPPENFEIICVSWVFYTF